VPRLAAAVEAVRSHGPDAVLLSGDLAENAADEEYEQLRELLEPVGVPAYVLPGNHDDAGALQRHFGVPDPVRYSVELGPLRLVVLDSTIPGQDDGALAPEQLEWLDGELTAGPDTLTLIAMHHPPFVTGMRPLDELGIPAADRRALADVLERHRQVRRIAAGHFHRAMTGDLAGRPVLTVPSTYVQFRLNFAAQEIEFASAPPAFAVHAVVDGELISHIEPVEHT
jgi:3',5'-cyclic AMP phosphodiesterase CpdA